MNSLCRRIRAVCSVVLSVGLVALLPGCDWLSGSDNVQRSSPFLSDLVINRAAVFCGENNGFLISFGFDDPQGDLAETRVLLRHPDDAPEGKRTEWEESFLWPEGVSRSMGTLTIPLSFSCSGPEDAEGDWSIEVTALDDRGHESNILQGRIKLL